MPRSMGPAAALDLIEGAFRHEDQKGIPVLLEFITAKGTDVSRPEIALPETPRFLRSVSGAHSIQKRTVLANVIVWIIRL